MNLLTYRRICGSVKSKYAVLSVSSCCSISFCSFWSWSSFARIKSVALPSIKTFMRFSIALLLSESSFSSLEMFPLFNSSCNRSCSAFEILSMTSSSKSLRVSSITASSIKIF
ncbi:MAG: hypothetical protein FWE22_05010 [Firmicutes bacterium]|nr:hypothetical protein [Bacillota bacterium]